MSTWNAVAETLNDEIAPVGDHLGHGRFSFDLEAVGAVVTVVWVEALASVLFGFRFVLALSGENVRTVAVLVQDVCVHFVHSVDDGFLFERSEATDGEPFLAIFPLLLLVVFVEQVYAEKLGCATSEIFFDALLVR